MQTKNKFRWLVIFILLLSLPTLACGVFGGGDEATAVPEEVAPTDTPEPEPTDTPEPVPTDTPEVAAEGPAFRELSDLGSTLENFDSYRLSVVMTFTGEGEDAQQGGVTIETAVRADPPASTTSLSMEGELVEEASGMSSFSVAEIGDQVYMTLPGMGCISGSGEEMGGTAEEFSDVFDTEELLGEIGNAEYIGEETVNGIPVYHYRFDENDVDDAGNEMRELEGNVYLAQEGNYVVSMVVDGVGALDLFGEGTEEEGAIHIEYNVTDVNGEFEIGIPEGCEDAGAEYPVMPDATNQASFGGFTSYETESSIADVVVFYEEEMAALGYETGQDSFTSEEMATLTFVQEGMPNVSVTVSRDEGATSVLITSEEEAE